MQSPAFGAFLLAAAATAAPTTFENLTEGATIGGFRAIALYLDAADRPFGARFLHIKTGFTLDLIQLQSVPQAFLYATTYPTTDKGEPHTQEHLLVGKGNKGRMLSESDGMTLSNFTAFTMQWRTCYPFNTEAGLPVFYQQFERFLDALLHPDYSDEEIRREVRNFGVSEDAATHVLHLDEKGTVYNEMVSTSGQQYYRLYHEFFRTVYGPEHPLSFESGGTPAGIREMLPSDIRKFHREHYFLGNMGSIVSLPKGTKGETVGETLAQLDRILNRVQPEKADYAVQSAGTLPAPKPAPAGGIAIHDYPSQNDKQPGVIAIAWPPDRNLNPRDEMLLNLFLENIASDTTSDLYRLFINSQTRKFDIDAAGVFSYLATDPGHAAMIGLYQVAVANLTEARIGEVRRAILDELARIAAMADASAELRDFNTRVRNRITQDRRFVSKIVNSPPGFGFRNGNAFWMQRFDLLNKEPGFRKSLTMSADYAAIETMLASERNIWKDLLKSWRLTGVMPYGLATRPNPALLKQEADERSARVSAETQRLIARYKAGSEREALQLYKNDYDAKTAELDKLAAETPHMKFIENPPLTLDEHLDYRVEHLKSGVPVVASTFDNMTSVTAGLALRLDGVPESDLFLLTLLPDLITRTGVIMNGRPVSYEEMQEMLKTEILSLNAGFASDMATSRVEFAIQGTGNDLAESRRALEWVQLALAHPNWRMDNLARIRDVVNQALTSYRSAMQGAEEGWVHNPINTYYKQTDPLYLTTSSFLTGAHNVDRLRWMLKDAGTPEDRTAIHSFLDILGRITGSAAERKTLLAAIESTQSDRFSQLTPRARELAIEVAKDLSQLLPDLPDATLASDWSYMCKRIAEDLDAGPEKTLARLDALRASILKTGNARMWVVGSAENQRKIQADLEALAGKLEPAPRNVIPYSRVRRIDQRLEVTPRFVGLFNPNMQGAVFNSMVPFIHYRDTDRESLLRYLTLNLFGGGGAHSIFTKIISAGLSYGGGTAASPRNGLAVYYGERMPDVTQTLHFVADAVRNSPRDPHLTEYAIALAFRGSNAASSYESRARSIADDLTDGITPDVVKHFRQSILALRKEPDLAGELFKRIDQVYAPVLPGYGGLAGEVPGAVYFLIGNDKQFKSLDADVRAREQEHVYRLYPRDYWLR